MKKVVAIGALAVVAIGAGGYLYARRKAAPKTAPAAATVPTAKPAPPFVAPAINDKSDDLDRVFAACGRPKGDHTTPDTTKTFAGAVLRTVDYGHDDPKLGHVSVYLSFDHPSSGWRFRGASPSLAATDPDLTIDELRISLSCAANALDNEPSSDNSGPGDSEAPRGGKAKKPSSNAESSGGDAASSSKETKAAEAPSNRKTPSQDKAP